MSRTEREELDYQYSPSRWSTRLPAAAIVDEHCAITLANTKVARETLECDLGIEYLEPGGPVLDIYHPQTTTDSTVSVWLSLASREGRLSDAVFVFYHGGYWEAMGVEYAGTSALSLTKYGTTVVAVGYTLAPKANMTVIVEQCRKSLLFIHKRFPEKRMFVGGHSAGAQLSACLMVTDWSREEISEFSPQLQAERLDKLPAGFHAIVVWGEEDSTEFKRQSKEFSEALIDHGVPCTNIYIKGSDHFEYNERLHEDNFIVTQLIIKVMTSTTR